MTDFRCTCCPYGYHLDTDFMKFLDDMYGPDVLRTLKKIERKRHDVRRRLINEQVGMFRSFFFCANDFFLRKRKREREMKKILRSLSLSLFN